MGFFVNALLQLGLRLLQLGDVVLKALDFGQKSVPVRRFGFERGVNKKTGHHQNNAGD